MDLWAYRLIRFQGNRCKPHSVHGQKMDELTSCNRNQAVANRCPWHWRSEHATFLYQAMKKRQTPLKTLFLNQLSALSRITMDYYGFIRWSSVLPGNNLTFVEFHFLLGPNWYATIVTSSKYLPLHHDIIMHGPQISMPKESAGKLWQRAIPCGNRGPAGIYKGEKTTCFRSNFSRTLESLGLNFAHALFWGYFVERKESPNFLQNSHCKNLKMRHLGVSS